VRQYKILERSMQIVFWDLMPYDFDVSLPPEASYRVLTKRMRAGSLIVLHDRASASSLQFLDRFIRRALDEGYLFVPVHDISGQG
jgi:peptidoglycan/xylan/chitin deacetylase (PgdA/CDA1 family)